MEHYSVSARKGMRTRAATWMHSEDITLKEASHQRLNTVFSTYMKYLEGSDSEKQNVDWPLPGAKGKRGGELMGNGSSFALGR